MSRPIIEVRGLSKKYRLGAIGASSLRDEFHRLVARARHKNSTSDKEFWALRNVDFDIQPGEVIGIIGRNGAGKSTLLKILSRITEPTTGSAVLRGRVASLLEVGTGFHPDLTGRENIYLNGAILGMTRAEVTAKFDAIVQFAEVEKFIDTPVKRYSSGMYVRLAFAVAAHLEPEILVVDEVLAVGDAQFQKKCIGKMSEVSRTDGRTILFVSHNINAVRLLCTQTLWLEQGQVKAKDLTDVGLTRYLGASGKSQISEALAIAPRTESRAADPFFRSVHLVGADSTQKSDFMIGEPFDVKIVIESPRSSDSYVIGFHIATSDQQIVFSSNHYDTLSNSALAKGLNRYSCRIAGMMLAPGTYTISLAITSRLHAACLHALPDALRFVVEPVLYQASPGGAYLLDGRPGVIRTVLQWSQTTE